MSGRWRASRASSSSSLIIVTVVARVATAVFAVYNRLFGGGRIALGVLGLCLGR